MDMQSLNVLEPGQFIMLPSVGGFGDTLVQLELDEWTPEYELGCPYSFTRVGSGGG